MKYAAILIAACVIASFASVEWQLNEMNKKFDQTFGKPDQINASMLSSKAVIYANK